MTYPELDFSKLELNIEKYVKSTKKQGVISSGEIFKYKDCLVEINVAESEFWLHYDSTYPIMCIKDKIKHLDRERYSPHTYSVIQEVLEELLEQIE